MILLKTLFLLPGKGILLLPAAVTGYWVAKRPLFTSLLYISLSSMILNMHLKAYWRIPLPGHLEGQWAFPSGHYQFFLVFWGWLLCTTRSKALLFSFPLLAGSYGWALVANGFHTWEDLGGAAVAASFLIAVGICISRVWRWLNSLSTPGNVSRKRKEKYLLFSFPAPDLGQGTRKASISRSLP